MIASGPSIKDIDFNKYVGNYDFIGMNGAINLQDINFKYYVVIDENFVKSRWDLMLKILNIDGVVFVTADCLKIIMEKNINTISCVLKVIEPIKNMQIEQFMSKKITVSDEDKDFIIDGDLGFSKDIFRGVFDHHTVAYVALQLCAYLNYKQILMAGVDLNNFNLPRFYECKSNMQPTQLGECIDVIFRAFSFASHYLTNQGIQVTNLSNQSALTCFKKEEPI
ncbi:MAG: lipopolysaccharide biosynthesis protein [Acinetobacter sp.]|uniref:lipopolysaccharide biosynthesis protein n=1 Tax=Acinetobacter sp. TaxID=472 RepID=UPI003CFEA703